MNKENKFQIATKTIIITINQYKMSLTLFYNNKIKKQEI